MSWQTERNKIFNLIPKTRATLFRQNKLIPKARATLLRQNKLNFFKIQIFMSRENQERAKFIHQNVPFLMCLNIQSLRCHRDELKIELETYKNKPTIIALTETWLTKNDDLDDEYNLKHYQPIESKPRIRDTRGGVAFYVRECLQYRIIEYHCD